MISDSRWWSPTHKQVWANYSTGQKKFTCHMFNIKLEEKSYKTSFKALPVKIQRSKNRQIGLTCLVWQIWGQIGLTCSIVCKEISYISGVYMSKINRGYNVKPSAYYFYENISVDFQIRISIPLIWTNYQLVHKR